MWTVGYVCGAGGDAQCAALEAVEGQLCLLEVLEAMRCCYSVGTLEAVERGLSFGLWHFSRYVPPPMEHG